MPRVRSKPTNPFINAVLRKLGFERVKDAADNTQVDYDRLLRMADRLEPDPQAERYVDTAERLGIPLDLFMRGLTDRLSDSERASLGI